MRWRPPFGVESEVATRFLVLVDIRAFRNMTNCLTPPLFLSDAFPNLESKVVTTPATWREQQSSAAFLSDAFPNLEGDTGDPHPLIL